MEVTLTTREGVPVLVLSGRVDYQASHRLREQIEQVLKAASPRLVLDLSRVPTMDSGGIGTVVAAFVTAKRSGGRLLLAGPSKNVRQVLRTTRLDTVMEVFPSVEQALNAL